MSTKFFIVAITLIGAALVAGVYVSYNQSNSTEPASQATDQTTFTAEEVKKHDSKADCWTIISDSVYDITSYIPRHPGGDEILRACGEDATTLFTQRQTSDGESVGSGSPHSNNAQEQLNKLKIGTLH